MVASTKKAGPAGRLGARYGSLARKSVASIERVQRKKHVCQQCGAAAVKRIHTGIWGCRKCGDQFAGGAYVPSTGAGLGSQKTLRGITDKLVRSVEEEAEALERGELEEDQDEEQLAAEIEEASEALEEADADSDLEEDEA